MPDPCLWMPEPFEDVPFMSSHDTVTCYHHLFTLDCSKHPAISFKCVAGIKLRMTEYLHKNNKLYQFKHKINCLCTVFIWIHVKNDLQIIAFCFYLHFTECFWNWGLDFYAYMFFVFFSTAIILGTPQNVNDVQFHWELEGNIMSNVSLTSITDQHVHTPCFLCIY